MTPEEMAALHAAAMTHARPWSAAEISALLGQPGTFATTTPHSLAIGRVTVDEAELLTLATHPAARRQGHGRAALAAFHQRAADLGATTAFLEVASDNLAARALYGCAGYTQAGRRRGYYAQTDGAPVDALILRRALSPPAREPSGV